MMADALKFHGIKFQRSRIRIFPIPVEQVVAGCHPYALLPC